MITTEAMELRCCVLLFGLGLVSVLLTNDIKGFPGSVQPLLVSND